MRPVDLDKQRDIRLAALPPAQAERAARHLDRLPGLSAFAVTPTRLVVRYRLPHWTLAGIERQLQDAGVHLDGSLVCRITRALIHYSEAVQTENLTHPEREYRTKEIHIRAWEHHPHGDRDETPEELREYR